MINEIVSNQEYDVWIKMLKKLEPSAGAQELAAFIACILEYVWLIADERAPNHDTSTEFMGLIDMLRDYGEKCFNIFEPIVEKLFYDADVSFKRTSSFGDEYSIIVLSIEEFLSWEYSK